MSIKSTLSSLLEDAKYLAKEGIVALAGGLSVVALLLGLLVLLSSKPKPHHNDIAASSAMITNLERNSGGSGVILDSNEKESFVLTNAHVCKVAKKGGFVSNNIGQMYLVHSYKVSKTEDLCLIKVLGNLSAETTVADHAPKQFYDKASISGHPNLLPTVITSGHFSGKQSIQVMSGLKPCTKEDAKTMEGALICLLLGGMPTFTQYDTILVTATIMPGSSGSGVYNSNDDLAGVVFAGSGSLGYASTIPYENMKHFLDEEVKDLQESFPSNQVTLFGSPDKDDKDDKENYESIKKICGSPFIHFFKEICDLVDQDAIWHK